MKIVSIAMAHDSSACYLENGEIRYWNKQERLNRVKRAKQPFGPLLEIENNFDLSDVDFFVSASPFQELAKEDIANACFFNWHTVFVPFYAYFKSMHPNCERHSLVSHHLTHAANAFYNSGFDTAYVLVVDRNGSILIDRRRQAAFGTETETLYYCQYPDLFEVVYHNPLHWIGITGVYCLVSEEIGVGEMDNGKTMALAAYGKEIPGFHFFDGSVPRSQDVRLRLNDGSDVTYLTSDVKLRQQQFRNVLPAGADDEDLAHQVQKDTSAAVIRLIEEHVDANRTDNLCFTGGHAHNCLLNYEIAQSFDKMNFYPDPIPDDSGTSIGAAKYLWYQQTQSKQKFPLKDLYNCGL